MEELTLFKLGWHGFNGFEFTVLRIVFCVKDKFGFKGDLFSISSRFDKWLEVGFLFIRFEIKSPFE